MKKPLEPKFTDFVCVICRRLKSMRYEHKLSRTTPIPPICFGCETEYAPMNKQCGSFMDRRKARQIGALAEALRCEAAYTEWPAHWKLSPEDFAKWKAENASAALAKPDSTQGAPVPKPRGSTSRYRARGLEARGSLMEQ